MTQPLIGIFDSGLGGLTVVRELLRRVPSASFLYLGDTARVPYGNKSPETICQYALQDVAFLIERGATDIVIACNTVSAYALPMLQQRYPEVRFFDVITPAVQAAVDLEGERIGVIGTRATIGSKIYETSIKQLDTGKEVLSVACPLFVPLVEEGWLKHVETRRIVRRYLAPLRQKQMDTLILGCTHYPLLQAIIRASVQKRVTIIDSPSAVWNAIEKIAPNLLIADQHNIRQEYFFTDLSDRTREIACSWLGMPVTLKSATLSS